MSPNRRQVPADWKVRRSKNRFWSLKSLATVITKSKRAIINNKTASELYTKGKSRCSDKDVNSCTASYQEKKVNDHRPSRGAG